MFAAVDLPRIRLGRRLLEPAVLPSITIPAMQGNSTSGMNSIVNRPSLTVHIASSFVDGMILTHRGEHIEMLEKRLALHARAEHPLALFGMGGLAQFQRHVVPAVGHVDVVGRQTKTHGLIDGVMVGLGETALGELGYFDRLRLLRVLWAAACRCPSIPDSSQTLIPAGLGQGRDVGPEDAGGQWIPISPVQPYRSESAASRRMRPAQSCGIVRPGSSSIQGMAHFGRPSETVPIFMPGTVPIFVSAKMGLSPSTPVPGRF